MLINELMKEFSQLPELLDVEQNLKSVNKKTIIQATATATPLLISNIWKKRKEKTWRQSAQVTEFLKLSRKTLNNSTEMHRNF